MNSDTSKDDRDDDDVRYAHDSLCHVVTPASAAEVTVLYGIFGSRAVPKIGLAKCQLECLD